MDNLSLSVEVNVPTTVTTPLTDLDAVQLEGCTNMIWIVTSPLDSTTIVEIAPDWYPLSGANVRTAGPFALISVISHMRSIIGPVGVVLAAAVGVFTASKITGTDQTAAVVT